MARKKAQAFRTISEVSDWLDTPSHVLRFWESKFSQIKPVKRAGGRRYYRPEDLKLIGGIKVLLHDEGNTIAAVQDMIKEEGEAHIESFSPEPNFPTKDRRRKRAKSKKKAEENKAADAPETKSQPLQVQNAVAPEPDQELEAKILPETPPEPPLDLGAAAKPADSPLELGRPIEAPLELGAPVEQTESPLELGAPVGEGEEAL